MHVRFVALFYCLMFASPASSAEKPDFSPVLTSQQVQSLAREGRLVRIYLVAIRFGGPRTRENISYVPPEAAEAWRRINASIERFGREGLIDQLDIRPEYRGNSLVPTRIRIHATHSSKGGEFQPTIDIW